MDQNIVTIPVSHLSRHTRRVLDECVEGLSTEYKAESTDAGILFHLPDAKYARFPEDLFACVQKALEAGTDTILFTAGGAPVEGLTAYDA